MQRYKLINNPKIVFLSVLILGTILLCYSFTMPKFTDENKYQELNDKYYQGIIKKDAYYQHLEKISTNKIFFMDLGSGIATFSLFFLVALLALKIRKWKDFENMHTQKKKEIFIMSNITWLLMILGTFLYYFYRGSRGDYPPFADSIGIPIMQQTISCLLLFIPLNLFLLLTLIKSKLPAKLFLRPYKCRRKHILWELFFDFFLLIDTVCLILFTIDGDHISIIVSICLMYVLLSLRAGKLNYYDTKLEKGHLLS